MDKNKKLSGEKKKAQVYKKGERYHCAVCHSELLPDKDCPSCHANIDWERAGEIQTNPFFPG